MLVSVFACALQVWHTYLEVQEVYLEGQSWCVHHQLSTKQKGTMLCCCLAFEAWTGKHALAVLFHIA